MDEQERRRRMWTFWIGFVAVMMFVSIIPNQEDTLQPELEFNYDSGPFYGEWK